MQYEMPALRELALPLMMFSSADRLRRLAQRLDRVAAARLCWIGLLEIDQLAARLPTSILLRFPGNSLPTSTLIELAPRILSCPDLTLRFMRDTVNLQTIQLLPQLRHLQKLSLLFYAEWVRAS